MRVDGPGRAIGGGGGAARAPSSGAVFRILDPAAPEAPRGAASLRSAPGLDALLAMQEMPALPVDRRKHALKRGRGLLDTLDEMKIALLDGRDDGATLRALGERLGAGREPTGDAGLDETLAAIDLRAQVELAKRGG